MCPALLELRLAKACSRFPRVSPQNRAIYWTIGMKYYIMNLILFRQMDSEEMGNEDVFF